MRFAAFWMSLAVVATMIAGASQGLAASSDEVRVRMVDKCVYAEWKYPGRRDKAASRCKCAAKNAIKSLSKAELADSPYFGDGLTSTQSSALNAAMKSCK